MMDSRERVRATLSHKEPDRVPIDFDGTICTGMHVTCVAALREYYGLEKRLVKVYEPFQMLGLIEEDLREALGLDVQGINGPRGFFGFPNEGWKTWRFHGMDVLVPEKFNVTTDALGNTYIYPQGDASASPSGRLPKDGFYFDAVIRQEPLGENDLNPEDNLEEFQLIPDRDLEYYRNAVESVKTSGDAVVANFGGTGLGDVALVPGPALKHPKGIRDIEEWYVSTVIRQDYVRYIFDKQTEIAVSNLKQLHQVVGDSVDVVFICGTDFGTQTSTFCSESSFRDLWMPYYKRMNNWVHENTNWKTFKHCCGAIEPFIGAFIESGFDILNPVQCSAAGMDPELLKSKYGDRIVFWGGGVDTQKTLPFGTPKEVREQVLRRCDVFSENGGFVFGAIHNVQANTPVENIVAMIDAVHEFNGIR